MTYEKLRALYIAAPLALVAIPLFIDLRGGEFMLEKSFVVEEGKVPFPLGGAALSIAFLVSYVFSILYKNEFEAVLTPKEMVLFYCLLVPLFLIHTVFISDLSLTRVAQLLLPVIALSVLTVPRRKDTQKLFSTAIFLGGGLFFFLHLTSLMVSSERIFELNHIEFSFVYEYLIYQSLVTYPGVLSLYFFCALGGILSSRCGFSAKLLLVVYALVILALLLVASRRASMLEVGGGLIIMFFGPALIAFLRGRVKISSVFVMIFAICMLPLLYYAVVTSPLYQRAAASYGAGSFDSGRLDIYDAAFDHFIANPGILFFGAGGDGAVGFHNFFLDTVFRIGIAGIFLYFYMIYFLTKKFLRLCKGRSLQHYTKNIVLTVLVYLLLIQTFVNTSITQPYYAMNFLSALLLVQFYLFQDEKPHVTG